MKVIRLLYFDFPAKFGGKKVCLMHGALLAFRRNSSLSIDLDLFITRYAENSACQEDRVAAIFDFVTIGLVAVLCLTSRTFRQHPHHNKRYFGP